MALTLGEKFSQQATIKFFEQSVTSAITNDSYEGELSSKGADRLNIKTYFTPTVRSYTKRTDMTREEANDTVGELVLDQQKYFYFDIDSVEAFEEWLDNPDHEINKNGMGSMWETIDAFVLGLYGDAGAGNWDGTDYTTGTVEVAATTGVVTGSGTTWVAGMVGKPFKALGHSAWYRISARNSNTEIVIIDDSDDEVAAYTGGAIAALATYTIQANTAVQVTKTNFYQRVLKLKEYLDANKIPKDDRWLVLPSWLENIALQSPELIPAVAGAYEDVVLNGMLGRVAGFKVYGNQQVAGDSVNGSRVLAGHKSAITFALAFKETGVEENIPKQFGTAFKSLYVYGAKVVDERRKALAQGYWKA